MKNSDMPAMPNELHKNRAMNGLTKREYFAGLAMQAVISNDAATSYAAQHNLGNPDGQPGAIADYALACADALLNQLQATKGEG